MSATFSQSTQLFHDFLGKSHSRKLLQQGQNHHEQSIIAAAPPDRGEMMISFDSNVLMVLSVLLCALICAIGLASVLKCTLRAQSSDQSSGAGSDNKGVKQKALKTFPVVKYSADLKLPGLDAECVICLSEFGHGERVRLLPKCSHGFHVRCIDKWLTTNSSCPKCRQCLIETCQKIVGCSSQQAASSSSSTAAMQEIVISTIVPVEPEGLVCNNR